MGARFLFNGWIIITCCTTAFYQNKLGDEESNAVYSRLRENITESQKCFRLFLPSDRFVAVYILLSVFYNIHDHLLLI